nr:MAG TPA: hypothetical protein [Caudoviricetes sp.]
MSVWCTAVGTWLTTHEMVQPRHHVVDLLQTGRWFTV